MGPKCSVYDNQHITVIQARKHTVNNKLYIRNDLLKVLAKPYIKGVVYQNKNLKNNFENWSSQKDKDITTCIY